MTDVALSGQPLPPELAQRLQSELQPGEIVVWTGQPDPNILARRGIFFTIFGLFFLAVPVLILTVILVIAFATRSFFPLCFAPFLLLFLVIGTFITLMPLWNRRAARQTLYAFTNRRAIVWRKTIFSLTVRSFAPDRLANMFRREKTSGAGDLVFYESTYRDMDGDRRTAAEGFFAVPNVRAVEDLLRATLLTAKPGATS